MQATRLLILRYVSRVPAVIGPAATALVQLSLLLRTGIFSCIPILRIRLASNDVFPTI